jgi:hypothetical protein
MKTLRILSTATALLLGVHTAQASVSPTAKAPTAKKAHAASKAKKLAKEATYTCPMHPEIHEHKPGHCPKCGMDLVKEKA